ncbi:LOW QUALITY PROTEIN: hypothetical protein PHMEG_0002916 [Phytophthora megakarya]|uniref:Reverse transcriptase n=1 Tax=Phytophthora megakarya TaxID=4795 RepID=A0A225WXC4_9STRA|nr:LOW QUALITY PROTEIN: hypothetical protein PHMEG_0002916 [Phytophthora megakarya]
MTVFKRNIPAPTQMSPVLGHILLTASRVPSWHADCASGTSHLPKSEFGKLSFPYLSHEISAEEIRAMPKTAKGVQDLPFPTTMKGAQSVLGSLNYYHKY